METPLLQHSSPDLIQEIEQKIGLADTAGAIEQLYANLYCRDVVNLRYRFINYQKESNKGTVSFEQRSIMLAQINDDILSFLEKKKSTTILYPDTHHHKLWILIFFLILLVAVILIVMCNNSLFTNRNANLIKTESSAIEKPSSSIITLSKSDPISLPDKKGVTKNHKSIEKSKPQGVVGRVINGSGVPIGQRADSTNLVGQVINEIGVPIPLAQVVILDNTLRIYQQKTTDSLGRFNIPIFTPNDYFSIDIRVIKEGYKDKTLQFSINSGYQQIKMKKQ